MPQDFSDMKSLEMYATELEVRPVQNESEKDYRARLAVAVLKEYGDSVLAAQIVTGKEADTFDEGEQGVALFLHMLSGKIKKAKYTANGDSHFNMPWKGYKAILAENGFRKVLSYEFEANHIDTKIKEEYTIWFEDKKALLLVAESYNGKHLNSTKLYYELNIRKPCEELNELERILLDDVLKGCSYGPIASFETIYVDRDVREGLKEHIYSLESSGFETNNPWKCFDEHFLWLCDYSETKVKGFDYKAIAKRKLNSLPEDVKVMLGIK